MTPYLHHLPHHDFLVLQDFGKMPLNRFIIKPESELMPLLARLSPHLLTM
jgi:hypothetical protein